MKSGFCIGGGMFDYIREFQTLAEHLNFRLFGGLCGMGIR